MTYSEMESKSTRAVEEPILSDGTFPALPRPDSAGGLDWERPLPSWMVPNAGEPPGLSDVPLLDSEGLDSPIWLVLGEAAPPLTNDARL